MRPEFYGVYRDLNELYRQSQLDLRYEGGPGLQDIRDLRSIDDAITQTVNKLGLSRRLRPDARLFLLVNFHQMVALPLAHVEIYGAKRLPIEQIVSADAQTILEAARDETREGEITGHAIMSTVSRVWRQLRATEIDMWG